jgi:hypothetical protein
MGAQTSPGLSDEKAARMMAGLRDGRTLRTLYVSHAQFKTYCAAHPEHAQEALPLIEANAKSARLRKGERLRSKTHCKHGHSLVDARIYFCKGYIKRDCRTCWKIRSKRGGAITTEVLGKVTAALEHGATIGSFTGAGSPTYLVMHSTFSRRRRENPEFDRFVSEATKDNKRKGQKLRFQRVRNAAVRDQNNDYYKIIGLMPSNLPPDIREDIVQSIFVAMLEGSLRRDDVRFRVQEFVAAHNRDANKHGTGKYWLRSIDAPAFAESSTTFGDTISRGLWD